MLKMMTVLPLACVRKTTVMAMKVMRKRHPVEINPQLKGHPVFNRQLAGNHLIKWRQQPNGQDHSQEEDLHQEQILWLVMIRMGVSIINGFPFI